MMQALDILAGPKAIEILRERGFRAADVDMVVGASGGPKWQVLAGLDRVLFGELRRAERERPLQLLGSSIGSWRMACLAQDDPVAAIERFEEIYLDQRYSKIPGADEITRVAEELLDRLLDDTAVDNIIDSSWTRLNIITTRSRGLIASENRRKQMTGLALAALLNIASRKTLGWQAERMIFTNAGSNHPFRKPDDQPTGFGALTRDNLKDVLLASGAIPLVFRGRSIPGAPDGIYRDGGLIDYHPDIDFGSGDGLVLYPHFYPEVIPGWFDKKLSWRRGGGRNFDRVLLLAPKHDFIASLPGGRIPDRSDFHNYDDAHRTRIWRGVLDSSKRLGEEFAELVESGRWMDRIRSFPKR